MEQRGYACRLDGVRELGELILESCGINHVGLGAEGRAF